MTPLLQSINQSAYQYILQQILRISSLFLYITTTKYICANCQKMDPAIIYSIVSNILQGNDNTVRNKAEQSLTMLYLKVPDQTACIFLDILAIHINTQDHSGMSSNLSGSQYLMQVKRFIILQLKLCLGDNIRQANPAIWHTITLQTQQRIKQQLFTLLLQQPDLGLAKALADTIGHLAAHLIVHNDSTWPNFKSQLLQVFIHGSEMGIYCGFYILQSFFENKKSNHKNILPQLHSLFETGFQQTQNIMLNLATLKCFAAYLLVLDHENHNKYHLFIPYIFKIATQFITKHQSSKALMVLIDIMDEQPKFLKPAFGELLSCFINIHQLPQAKQSIKKTITIALVDYCQKYPSLFRSNLYSLSSLLDMIVMRMISTPFHITESWMAPEQGFDQDNCDQPEMENTTVGMHMVNQVIRAVGKEESLMHACAIIQKLLSVDNWNYTFVAVMLISQLGEYMENVKDVQHYLVKIVELFNHENPRLRYAASHAIGQISQDMKPKFQERYGNQIFFHLCQLLFKEPVPRVINHIQGALTNFLQGVTFNLVSPQFVNLVAALIDNAKNGISIVKQSAIGSMASLFQIAGDHMQPYIQVIFSTISSYFYNRDYQHPSYNRLRGQSIETCTYIAMSFGKQNFRSHLHSFVEIMLILQNPQYSSYIPPLHYILSAWQRLSAVYGVQLQQYIDQFLPNTLNLISSIIAKAKSSQNTSKKRQQIYGSQQEEEGSQISQSGYQKQDIKSGLLMLNSLNEQLFSLSDRYLQETMTIYSTIIRDFPDQQIKQYACKGIPILVKHIKKDQVKVLIAKNLISDLVISIQSERNSVSISDQVKAVLEIMRTFDYPFLDLTNLQILTNKLVEQMEYIEEDKANIIKGSNALDEDQLEDADSELLNQQEILLNLCEVFCQIFKLYKEESYFLAQQLLSSFLRNVFVQDQRQKTLKSALFLIDDMIQHIGYNALKAYWPWLEQILVIYSTNPRCSVRQAACYGLGIFAEQTPMHLRTSINAISWIDELKISLTLEKQKRDKANSYRYCRDNITAAIGKIMRAHLNLIEIQPYLDLWLAELPLRKDLPQGIIQTYFLMQLITERIHLLLGSVSIQKICRIIQILGNVVKHKLYKPQMLPYLQSSLKMLAETSFFQIHSGEIMQSLTEQLKESLSKLYESSIQSATE